VEVTFSINVLSASLDKEGEQSDNSHHNFTFITILVIVLILIDCAAQNAQMCSILLHGDLARQIAFLFGIQTDVKYSVEYLCFLP
jgi:hypothetical protein